MEELRKYLEEKKKEYEKDIEETNISDSSIFLLHERVETYQEIINYIDNIKNK